MKIEITSVEKKLIVKALREKASKHGREWAHSLDPTMAASKRALRDDCLNLAVKIEDWKDEK